MSAATRTGTTPDARTNRRRPSPANTRSRNDSRVSDTAARIIGILILAGWFTYGPGGAITASIVSAPDILANVAANQAAFTAGAVLMLLNSAAVVGIGVMWYPILKRHSERVALTYLATRILEAVFCAAGVMSLLALTGLAEAHLTAGGAAGAPFETLSSLAIQLNDLSYQIGMATLGIGSLFFCALLYRTGLIPRTLAAWGFVGYGVFAAGMVADMFGLGVGLVLTIPGGLFELAFAGLLIVKGLRPSATTAALVPAGAAQMSEAR